MKFCDQNNRITREIRAKRDKLTVWYREKPTPVHAAKAYPRRRQVLWISTKDPRFFGGTSSVIQSGMEPKSMNEPNPEKKRKTRNMAIWTDPANRAPEITIKIAGTVMAALRPKRSPMKLIARAPKNAPAWNKPFMLEIRLVPLDLVSRSKYSRKEGWAVRIMVSAVFIPSTYVMDHT